MRTKAKPSPAHQKVGAALLASFNLSGMPKDIQQQTLFGLAKVCSVISHDPELKQPILDYINSAETEFNNHQVKQ